MLVLYQNNIHSSQVDTIAFTNHNSLSSYPVDVPSNPSTQKRLLEMGTGFKEQYKDLDVFFCVKAKISDCFACLGGLCPCEQYD